MVTVGYMGMRCCHHFYFVGSIGGNLIIDMTSTVVLEQDQFDVYKDATTGETLSVTRFTWKNSSGIQVQVITYGGTITSIKLPDKNGTIDDIVMGFDDMKGYLDALNPYFGATVGRVANRIGGASFTIDGVTYNVTANEGKNILHGGLKGFDKVNWNYYVSGNKVILSYLSKDQEEGFPGDVIVNTTYELTDDNRLLVDYQATTSKPTYVNLTNHSYINLAGHNTGSEELYKHVVSVNADYITEVDAESIPTGNLLPVAGTVFDLRIPKTLSDVIDKVPGYSGFDHNFCVTKGTTQENTFMARAVHPTSARVIEVYSNQPGVQFYTANNIPAKTAAQTITGKGGSKYYEHGALCFENQNYPDAINHKNFPPAVLYPGQIYHRTFEYRFFVNQ
ncbi:galactose mutarotase-like isoform X1 [Cylas formicarius]|uniref:galactose mutarotase-like isoform X1 n=1 Tax=Cylas formicarius TaxID=197179 RepID=UPI0029583890|nr:galactose mutarotase-like isoform X1 [Cylas formicarius]